MNEARILAAASSGMNSQSTSPGAAISVYTPCAGWLNHHAEVAEDLGQRADVLDLGHVLEPAPLAREDGGSEQLEGGVLGPRDVHGPAERPAALDAERLRGRGVGDVLPVERPGVSHDWRSG